MGLTDGCDNQRQSAPVSSRAPTWLGRARQLMPATGDARLLPLHVRASEQRQRIQQQEKRPRAPTGVKRKSENRADYFHHARAPRAESPSELVKRRRAASGTKPQQTNVAHRAARLRAWKSKLWTRTSARRCRATVGGGGRHEAALGQCAGEGACCESVRVTPADAQRACNCAASASGAHAEKNNDAQMRARRQLMQRQARG